MFYVSLTTVINGFYMTKRPQQHQLEDLSRIKFQFEIPRNWVCRDKDKDYGIDLEVEIFDENDRATGLVFWVQLKATSSNKNAVIKKIDLSIDSVRYYKTLEIPVLIARYSEVLDCFYLRWAHSIDLFYAKKDAKTIRLSFNEQNLWEACSPQKIQEHLKKIRTIRKGRISFPISAYLDVQDDVINTTPKAVFASSFRIALDQFSEFTTIQSSPENSLFKITIRGDELTLSLCSVYSCSFHNIKSKNKKDDLTHAIVMDSLLGLAVVLAQAGQSELAGRIVLNKKLEIRFIEKKEILLFLIPPLLSTSHFSEIIDIVNGAISKQEDSLVEMVTIISSTMMLNGEDDRKNDKVEELLSTCLNKYISLNEKPLIGTFYYNLGNHYRGRRESKKSIDCYLKARKFEKSYLTQPYYYQELAGALFEYGKYYFSVLIYKKSLDNGAPKTTTALYADALMHNGKYQLAAKLFDEYLETSTKENDEQWYLKLSCLEEIIDKENIKDQIRYKKLAIETIKKTTSGSLAPNKSYKEAIKLDSLCGLARFNLGIENARTGNYEQALFNFTLCGLVQTWDIEAWINAVLCCINVKESASFFPLLIRTGFFYNGDSFITSLYQKLKGCIDPERFGVLASAIENIIPKKNDLKDRPIIRLKGKDDSFLTFPSPPEGEV